MRQNRQRDNASNDNGADFRQVTPLGWVLHYGIAVAAVAAGFGLRLTLTAWVGPGLPTFITFYPAVMAVALGAGLGPGLLATALTDLVVSYWIIQPAGQSSPVSPVDLLGLVIFAVMGLAMSMAAELYRRRRDKAAAYDRELALRETRREKEFLANLLEHAAQPFAVGYPDGRISRINRAYEQLTGYTAAELHALDWSTTLTPPEWREMEKQKLDELRRTGQPVRYEKEYARKDGSRVPVELLVHLMCDAEGKPEYYYSFLTDISEHKQAEEALRESREDMARAQEVGKIGSWRLDIKRNILTWSDENHRIFGIPKETPMSYETFLECVYPDDREYVDRKWRAGLAGEPYDIEHRINAGGKVKWVREKAYLEFCEDGSLLGGFGITQEITERKQTQAALQRSEASFKLLSETAEELIKWKNVQIIINDLCQKTMAHLGCQVFFNFLVDEKAGMLHLNAYAGIPEEDAGKIEWIDYGVAVCGCSARDKVPIIIENILATNDPRTELVKCYGIQAHACYPLIVQEQVIGTLSFGTRTRTSFSQEDLVLMKRVADQVATAMERNRLINEIQQSRDELETRVKERTAELEKMNEALRQSNLALEDFAHVASHDLQEPLRKIRTFAERLAAIKHDSLSDQTRDYLARMQHAAERMQSLIQDLLKYSRVTSRPGHFTVINLRGPVEDAVKDLSVLIEETEAQIEIDELPDVEVNRMQVSQLFANLINNALKYRSKQKPLIRIYGSPSSEDLFHEIHVKDNGIGFDELYLDRIFKPFQRLHGKDSPYQGTGMGLAICRKIMEYHRGSITAKSEPGKGSTFILRLPKVHLRSNHPQQLE